MGISPQVCLRCAHRFQLIMLHALSRYFCQPAPKLYWASMWLTFCFEGFSLILHPYSLYTPNGLSHIAFVISVFLWIRHDTKRSSVSGLFDLGILTAVYWPLIVTCHIASSRGFFSLLKYSIMYFGLSIALAMMAYSRF